MDIRIIGSLVTGVFLSFNLKINSKATELSSEEDKVDTLRFVDTFRHETCNPILFCYDSSGHLINSKVLLNGFARHDCFYFVHSDIVKEIKWITAGDAAYHVLKIKKPFPKILYTTPNALNNRFCGFYVSEDKIAVIRDPETKGMQIGAYGEKGDTCDVSIRSGRHVNGNHIQKHFQAWGFTAFGDTLKGAFNGLPVIFIYKDKSTVILDTKRREDRPLLKTIIKDCSLEYGIYKRFGYTIGDVDSMNIK